MRYVRSGAALAATVTLAVTVAAAAAGVSADASQRVAWQPHRAQLHYFGITSRYSCLSLQSRFKQILQYLGARDDASVQASGCFDDNAISRSITLVANFSTLRQSDDASASLTANWSAVELRSQMPLLLDDGDCELIEQSRRLILENFTWRKPPRYEADCPLNATAPGDYRIQGETLKPAS